MVSVFSQDLSNMTPTRMDGGPTAHANVQYVLECGHGLAWYLVTACAVLVFSFYHTWHSEFLLTLLQANVAYPMLRGGS
ncbi:hypothetical protein AWZ03_008543 [Drosophila navojoa]|uniref:Uncharacterized protein n=1 Tax=Drosophila navojoa TaxID=7232 RepID=A0A484B9R2_DRONA|nr:hypothetical protein AWZ03_008543 [Drosophila navojoa]